MSASGASRRARAAALLGALVVACLATACWPAEGFDAARSGFNPLEATLTARNVGGLTRAWVVDTGATATTPIAVANTVFVGSADAVASLGTATGANRWTRHNTDLASSGFTASVGPLTAVNATVLAPVSWGVAGNLFTFDDATGARTSLLRRGRRSRDSFSAAGCGHTTCAPEWSGRTTTSAAVSHQPAAAGDVVYVGTTTGSLYAFAADG